MKHYKSTNKGTSIKYLILVLMSAKKLRQAFGRDENGITVFPYRISNVQYARILYGDERGCSGCFPHGYETNNSTISKYQRSWKKYRLTQWKIKTHGL